MSGTPLEWDIFLSYSHADDIDLGDGVPWVQKFATDLTAAVHQELGISVKLFRDKAEGLTNGRVPELTALAGVSAIYLGLGSPSYNRSPYTADELEAFITRQGLGRVFMAEIRAVPEPTYPAAVRTKLRRLFHRPAPDTRRPMTVSGLHEPMTYRQEIDKLASDIAAELQKVDNTPYRKRKAERDELMASRREASRITPPTSSDIPPPPVRTGAATPEPAAPPPKIFAPKTPSAGTPDAPARKTVLVAWCPGLEVEALQVSMGLEAMGVPVRPKLGRGFPDDAANFKSAFTDCAKNAQIFVQLLGPQSGPPDPEFPDGCAVYQHDTALAHGLTIMQWRHPDLDLPDPATPHDELLDGPTVTTGTLPAFIAEVRKAAEKPPELVLTPGVDWVFISHDASDAEFAQDLAEACSEKGALAWMSSVPDREIGDYLAYQYKNASKIVVLYGSAGTTWAASQLQFYTQARSGRTPPEALVLCLGPPEPSKDLPVVMRGLERQRHDPKWTVDPIIARLFNGRGDGDHVRH